MKKKCILFSPWLLKAQIIEPSYRSFTVDPFKGLSKEPYSKYKGPYPGLLKAQVPAG